MDVVELTQALIREASVTPDSGSALRLMEARLIALGFETHLLRFGGGEAGPEVPNLYARRGTGSPNFCFAGHTDVVPVGDASGWSAEPFAAEVKDGVLYGRGAADMKGALAAMLVAIERFLDEHPEPAGSISLLLTGDEEGPGIHGTKAVLPWLDARGERIDYCVVGEPTSQASLGDMIKIGRRGSLHGVVRVRGQQGHVAYPHLAKNPIPGLLKLMLALTERPFDAGNAHFQPSNLEVLDLHVGNDADNVIPAEARGRFNIRFNSEHSPESLMEKIRARCDAVGVEHTIEFRVSGDSFLTEKGPLTDAVVDAVRAVTGLEPELSTTGGTSDARFIKDHCPVVELGLVGASMHKVNERVEVRDLETLADIYRGVLDRLVG